MVIPPSLQSQTCLTCRHLEVDEGREFPQIADTAYLRYRCRRFGWEGIEHYLMKPIPEPVEIEKPGPRSECPGWEDYRSPSVPEIPP